MRIYLLASMGDARMEGVAREVLGRFAAAFPGRLRAAYALGSYADASAVATSDLDLALVFAGDFTADEPKQVGALVAMCVAEAAAVGAELDIEVEDEASLRGGVSPTLKQGSRLLWGEDVVAGWPLLPLVTWTRDRMHSSYYRLGALFGRARPLVMPLGYPDPADAFYGYARRPLRQADGREVPGTRDLIRAVGWMATALLAHQAGQYVATKRDCAARYRECIGDEWSGLIEDVYEWVRGAWQYRVPEGTAARARLRAICARTLALENHFLAIYRPYALSELRGEDPAGRAWALEAFEHLPLADAEVNAAISAATMRGRR